MDKCPKCLRPLEWGLDHNCDPSVYLLRLEKEQRRLLKIVPVLRRLSHYFAGGHYEPRNDDEAQLAGEIITTLEEIDTGNWSHCNSPEQLESFYKSVLPDLSRVAKECGYSLSVHGSMRKDLDLIAVPWVHEFAFPNTLAAALQEAACNQIQLSYKWETKPNGRITTSFPICQTSLPMKDAGHIDLSIIGA